MALPDGGELPWPLLFCLLGPEKHNRGRQNSQKIHASCRRRTVLSYRSATKIFGFPPGSQRHYAARRPLLDVRDDDEGQQTTGGTPRTVKMAQERDDLVYLAKLAEQAERFDEMARRRRGGIITPFVYLS